MKKVALLFAALLAYVGMAIAAVNINSATKEQLESLNGVGPVKAQAIIDYRKKNGPFKTLDDVKKVDGIGDATFDKIKGDIMLSGTTVPVKAAETKTEKVEKKVDAAADKTRAVANEATAATKKAASDTTDRVKEATDKAAVAAKKAAEKTKKAVEGCDTAKPAPPKP